MKKLTLIALSGPPGSGKSTLAHQLLRDRALLYVDTGDCWRSLFPKPEYSRQESEKVFDLLLEHVSSSLAREANVVAEGIFASHDRIVRLRQVANQYGARFFLVRLHCDSPMARTRMESRFSLNGQPVVPAAVWAELDKKLESWKDKEPMLWIDSTAATPESVARMVVEGLREW